MSVRSDAGTQPLRSVLKKEDEDDGDRTPPASGSLKAVQIEEPVPERSIDDEGLSIKQFKTSLGRRISGRALSSQYASSSKSSAQDAQEDQQQPPSQHHHHHKHLISQVGEWLERQKHKQSRVKRPHRKHKVTSAAETDPKSARQRASSIDSQASDASLENLQRILEDSMKSMAMNSNSQLPSRGLRPKHRKSNSRQSLQRSISSDTDYVDGDAVVPECDAWLDNSKTLGYGGTTPGTPDEASQRNTKEREAWLEFKSEIIRIAHTLRVKGWRRVPLEAGDRIDVERLSGALTNAVYVVSPPSDLEEKDGKRPPAKVLLRIYGAQVEHLIDRENELKVLQRLARKKIGPRLLGCFENGRFEEFFNASPLTLAELREADTSKQIAKRMRELHDGIVLLEDERDAGPGVWKNWDAWVDNVGRIVSFLDDQVETTKGNARRDSVIHNWKRSGHVCGVPWPQFRDMVIKYRGWMESHYKDQNHINEELVFAHNDTQYGNILRFQVKDEKSPLLQPANKHKQLIVIDFEYAAANLRGLEFANHFTEWTYNYHHATQPWACQHQNYPTVEEQRRFIKAYIDHRVKSTHGNSTPRIAPRDESSTGNNSTVTTPQLMATNSSSSIVDFMLDSRAPPGGWSALERAKEEQTEQQIKELIEETKLWRPANSAQWVAWGIVQAKVPGLDGFKEEDGGVDDFDYLSYAQDRATFFWGDCVQLGLCQREELPEPLRSRIKIVES